MYVADLSEEEAREILKDSAPGELTADDIEDLKDCIACGGGSSYQN